MLFEGPVKIMDLDHEQYGEAAAMRRKGLISIEEEEIFLTEKAMTFLVVETLHSLEKKGLAVNFPDGAMITPEGEMIVKGHGPIM